MTAVSYYRELFPLFVAELFIAGRFGLNARGSMSVLTVCNYFVSRHDIAGIWVAFFSRCQRYRCGQGGIFGGLLTFFFAHQPHKGRQVMIATLCYGATCFLFGATPLLYIGGLATALCGAADAVGATMRSTVVMLTTPDHLRGRARSGHSLAANCANSVGQARDQQRPQPACSSHGRDCTSCLATSGVYSACTQCVDLCSCRCTWRRWRAGSAAARR